MTALASNIRQKEGLASNLSIDDIIGFTNPTNLFEDDTWSSRDKSWQKNCDVTFFTSNEVDFKTLPLTANDTDKQSGKWFETIHTNAKVLMTFEATCENGTPAITFGTDTNLKTEKLTNKWTKYYTIVENRTNIFDVYGIRDSNSYSIKIRNMRILEVGGVTKALLSALSPMKVGCAA